MMKQILVIIIIFSQLLALVGCSIAPSSKKPRSESLVSEPTKHSSESSQPSVESISSIIESASSVEYKINSEWIAEDIDSANAKDFISRLTDLFPENFGEVASAYMPDDIVIKFNFAETAKHSINVNSSISTAREVEISTIEISLSGIVFLMPQGTALGAVKGVETILTTYAPPPITQKLAHLY